jgi:hypothetical protein
MRAVIVALANIEFSRGFQATVSIEIGEGVASATVDSYVARAAWSTYPPDRTVNGAAKIIWSLRDP